MFAFVEAFEDLVQLLGQWGLLVKLVEILNTLAELIETTSVEEPTENFLLLLVLQVQIVHELPADPVHIIEEVDVLLCVVCCPSDRWKLFVQCVERGGLLEVIQGDHRVLEVQVVTDWVVLQLSDELLYQDFPDVVRFKIVIDNLCDAFFALYELLRCQLNILVEAKRLSNLLLEAIIRPHDVLQLLDLLVLFTRQVHFVLKTLKELLLICNLLVRRVDFVLCLA